MLPISNTTTELLSLALDAMAMRQQAIAHNIANANTPGYQRLSVSFESRLATLQEGGGAVRTPALGELASLRPSLQVAERAEPVALDMELAELSETTLRHQALLKALNKQFALLGLAMNDGKR